jgi:predicted O-methyltransferase YrrM
MPGDDLPQLDTRHAHPARIYNYWLGGKDNFAADREAAEQAIAANPGIKTDVRANRAFLARVVRYLAGECGVRQFLDIGTGLPVAGNTHQVAQEVAPDARIVYADNDPIVLLHARALLSSTRRARATTWRRTCGTPRPEPGTLSPPLVTAWCGVARKR